MMEPQHPTIPLDYAPAKPQPWRRWPPRTLVAAAMVVAILGGSLAWLLSRTTCRNPRLGGCTYNLRTIHAAVTWYAFSHGGSFPDGPAELYLHNHVEPSSFICPCTNDYCASGPTTQAVAASLSARPCNSYVYLGKGLTTACPPGTIIAHDLPGNHPDGDINVLYADGSVKRHDARTAGKVLAELAAGHNPPRAE